MTAFIMFLVGIGIGALFCWLHTRHKYLDLKYEFEELQKLNLDLFNTAEGLREQNSKMLDELNNPWR